MNPLHSLFFTNLLSPHKTLPLPPSQFHSRKQSWFFFFLGQKLLQSITLSPCSGCSFLLLFFSFFFLCQKKFRRSSHCQKENFVWNYPEHWCEFNIWQNVMVEASTMVIWCCEFVIFFFNKNSSNLNHQNRSRFIEPGGQTTVRTSPYFFCM